MVDGSQAVILGAWGRLSRPNRNVWTQVQGQSPTDESKTDSRRDECHQHCSRENSQNDQRAASGQTPRTRGEMARIRTGQYLVLKDVIGNINAHEQSRVEDHRRRCELGMRDPCRSKGEQRHHEQVGEVDPDQSQCWRTCEPKQVMVVHPNDGNEEIAHNIADDRRPKRHDGGECRLVGWLELQHHDGHDHSEYRIGERGQPVSGYFFLVHRTSC